jgi:hypothetical protein
MRGRHAERRRLGPVAGAPDKKKPAGESGLKTIFLEENSGDKAEYAALPHICPIAILHIRHADS